METINIKVKKWGNSFGIILPKKMIDKKEIKEGTEIEITIQTKGKTKVKDIFGIMKEKLKKPTDEIMKETDKDLWGIDK
mgnify:CR=1 FL=1